MELITHLILSILFGYALAILLVEKGEDWPVTIVTKPLRFVLSKIYSKIPEMLECTVCMSFWTTLIGEVVLWLWITKLFLWPFTGIITLGFTWFVIEFLNSLDKNRNNENPSN